MSYLSLQGDNPPFQHHGGWSFFARALFSVRRRCALVVIVAYSPWSLPRSAVVGVAQGLGDDHAISRRTGAISRRLRQRNERRLAFAMSGWMISLLVASASAFAPSPLATPALARSHTASALVDAPLVVRTRPTGARVQRVSSPPLMGLFGLGWAEIGVIGVLAILFFGPDKLAPLAKDLGARRAQKYPPACVRVSDTSPERAAIYAGKSAAGLKEVTEEFKQGMAEGDTGISSTGGEKAVAAEGIEVKEEPPKKEERKS